MLSTRNPSRRRLTRIAGIALAAIVALPGVAVADHTDNCPDNDLPCKDFDPQLQVSGPENSFTDVPNGLTLRWGQQDHQKPVIDVTWYVPIGWKFAPNLVDPGIVAEEENGKAVGDDAETCTELYRGENNHNNDQAAFLSTPSGAASAENLFGGVGTTVFVNEGFPFSSRTKVDLGYGAGSRSGLNPTSQDPSIAFLDWDQESQTARMCMYLYANNPTMDHNDPGNQGSPATNAADHEISRQHIVPVELQRLPDEDPLSAEFDWSIHWDLTSFYSDPFLRGKDISVSQQLFQLPSITPGNFNVDDFGNQSGVVFSRSASTPGNYTIRADFRTCKNGMVPADTPTDTGCLLDELSDPVTRLQNFTLTPPPDQIRHEFARITGPQNLGLCNNQDFCPLGLALNTDNFDVTWEPPSTPPGVQVKGYALVVAEPGTEKSRHFMRFVTNSSFADDPNFASDLCQTVEIPPEEEGGEPTFRDECTTNIAFPLTSTDGSTILNGSSKYHLALVTIYDTGHRTDGLCDDGTGQGAPCDPFAKPIAIQEPGISEWQVLIRPERWIAFVETWDDSEFEPRDAVFNRLLLVSFGRQEAELIVWRNADSVQSFRQSSALILGSDTAGGLVQMQTPSLAGGAPNWEVTALIDLTLTGLVIGTFVKYELQDPNLNNPVDNRAQNPFDLAFCLGDGPQNNCLLLMSPL